MKMNEKKLGAEILLADMALLLLGETDPKGALKKFIDQKKTECVGKYGIEGYQRLMVCKNVLSSVATKLAACESQEEIVKTLHYVDAINTADIYIAATGQEIIAE